MRIVIAEDSVLLRAGLTRLLAEAGEEVIAAVSDGDALLEVTERHRPDIAVVDVRMPPTYTDEGIRAALVIRQRWPEVGILSCLNTSRSATPPSCWPATPPRSAIS